MILGMYCGSLFIASTASGGGISIAGIASAEQSSNNKVIRVNTEYTNDPIITKFKSRNSTNPRLGLIVSGCCLLDFVVVVRVVREENERRKGRSCMRLDEGRE